MFQKEREPNPSLRASMKSALADEIERGNLTIEQANRLF
jgi:hypothetical protein